MKLQENSVRNMNRTFPNVKRTPWQARSLVEITSPNSGVHGLYARQCISSVNGFLSKTNEAAGKLSSKHEQSLSQRQTYTLASSKLGQNNKPKLRRAWVVRLPMYFLCEWFSEENE